MLQFYFLSILLNLAVGLILALGARKEGAENSEGGEKFSALFSPPSFFADKTFRLVLGILSIFVGLMKLLSVVHDDIPVVGDLIPSLAGFLGGFALLVDCYRAKSSSDISLPDIVSKIFVDGAKYIGIFCVAAAFLHFIAPDALLL